MPSSDDVYSQLKDCVSEITKIPRGEITLNDSLSGDYGYKDGPSRRSFAISLERCFKKHGMTIPKKLDRDKMEEAKKLKNVRDIVFTAFGV
ncbi:MAG: hypothetical protein HYX37_10840 [Rhizobiales bacterium]|nr:hypothetical protein [Hyphomicrobiales bacterium]